MPLEVVFSQSPARKPRRRPLNGFEEHGLTLVPSGKSARRATAPLAVQGLGRPAAGKITDIASYREVAVAEASEEPPRSRVSRQRRLLLMAAIMPPVVWLGHALLSLL